MLNGLRKRCLSAAVVLAAGMGLPAAAQTPGLEVTGGYQAPTDTSIGAWFRPGWSVDVAANINDRWAIVGDAGGAYRSDDDLGVDLNLHTIGGGLRWSVRSRPRIVPFAQFLLGLARMSSSVAIAGVNIASSQTKVMLQPGGGVNVLIGTAWGLVGQADYRRIVLDEAQDGRSGINEIRMFAGVRFGF